jgi:hypothetical protein
VVDKTYRGRVSEIPNLIDEYFDAYLADHDVPPIRLEQSTKKLLDGYHRHEALKKIKQLIDQGELDKNNIPEVFVGDDCDLIHYEPSDIPSGIEACLFSLGCNMRHGRKASVEDIKVAVKEQFRVNPGYTAKELAVFLGVSDDTARRYAADAIREQKEKRNSIIEKCRDESKTQQQTVECLKEEMPGVRGTSRATVSAFLSENRNPPKTDTKEKGVQKDVTADVTCQEVKISPYSNVDADAGEAHLFSEFSQKVGDTVDAIVSRINSLPGPVKNEVLIKIDEILLEAESNMFPTTKHSEPSILQLVN